MDTNAPKRYTMETEPWYYGGYLNMARHNMFLISNEIVTKLKLGFAKKKADTAEAEPLSPKLLKDDGALPSSFLTDKDYLEKNNPRRIYALLRRFLPLAALFATDTTSDEYSEKELDIAQMSDILKELFAELNRFRNDYSHYYSVDREDRRKTELDEQVAVFLRNTFYYAIHLARKRFEGVIDARHFQFVEKEIAPGIVRADGKVTTRGLVFFCCLFLDKENAFHFINKVSGFKNTSTFDFLATREVFSVLCAKMPHDRFISENPEQALQLDILNYLNRAPAELYQALSAEAKKPFQPQLGKDERYNMTQNSIPEHIEEESYENYLESISVKRRHTDRFPEFALKFLDRSDTFDFYFQLHLGKSIFRAYPKTLLGETPEEPNRSISGDIKTFRNLHTFLGNHEEEREQVKAQITAEADFLKEFSGEYAEYFTQYAPHFHIVNNKIGILPYSNKKYHEKLYRPLAPLAFLSVHELPKVALLEILEPGSAARCIHECIQKSTIQVLNNDFIEEVKQSLAFDKEIKRQFWDDKLPHIEPAAADKKAFDDIRNKLDQEKKGRNRQSATQNLNNRRKALFYAQYVARVNERKEKLNTILAEYGLNHRQIPGRILDYWLRIVEVETAAAIKNRIRAERKECKQRIKALDAGKGPKIGEMASYLARDIVNLVIDEKRKAKISSFYYDQLQECLALYADAAKKQRFLDICTKELQLFDTANGHPFLADLPFNKIHKTKDLYRKYIERKGTAQRMGKVWNRKEKCFKSEKKEDSWLCNTFYSKVKAKDKTEIQIPESGKGVPLSYRRLAREESPLPAWLHSVTKGNVEKADSKPIDLPLNLFDDCLNRLLTAELGDRLQAGEKYNYSKLLAIWRPEIQPFYNWEREYVLFKDEPYEGRVAFKPGAKATFREYYEPVLDSVYRKRKRVDPQIQEVQVRRVFKKAIDENEKQLRFYQAKDRILMLMLDRMATEKLNISLAEIYPGSATSPLNVQTTISEKIGDKYNKYISYTRKRKDYALFRRFITDRRMHGLFAWYTQDTIAFEDLKKELDDYEKLRPQVLEMCFTLEQAIISHMSKDELDAMAEKANAKAAEKNRRNTHVEHGLYMDWLRKYAIITFEEETFYREIRNKFSHNEFPRADRLPKAVRESSDGITITHSIVTYYLQELQKLMEEKGVFTAL